MVAEYLPHTEFPEGKWEGGQLAIFTNLTWDLESYSSCKPRCRVDVTDCPCMRASSWVCLAGESLWEEGYSRDALLLFKNSGISKACLMSHVKLISREGSAMEDLPGLPKPEGETLTKWPHHANRLT